MDTVFNNNRTRVMSFMDRLNDIKDAEKADQRFRDSNTYKLRVIDKNKDLMRDHCIDGFCKRMYRDAVPLGDDFKANHVDDLDNAYDDFIKSRCPKGLTFYVREGLKKGSPFAKKLLECVENLVNEEYFDREMHVEDVDTEDLKFDSKKFDKSDKNEDLDEELGSPEISSKIYDMVKNTAVDQINKAKETKNQMKQLQDELSNDINMNTRAAVESALELRDITTKKNYNPTLFEGINIGKLNQLKPKFESVDTPEIIMQDALSMYTENELDSSKMLTLNELAFIEAVEEYTALLMSKAMKLESFGKYDVMDLAQEYAQKR